MPDKPPKCNHTIVTNVDTKDGGHYCEECYAKFILASVAPPADAPWDRSGLKAAVERGIAIGRTHQEMDIHLVRDMLSEIERLERIAAALAAEKEKVWNAAIEIAQSEVNADTKHDLGAHDLEDCAICSAFYQANATVKALEAARTADIKENK